MAKYDPLREHLAKAYPRELVMTFDEITALLGAPLPISATRPQFWANVNEDGRHVQRAAWRDANYDAFLLSGRNEVRFAAVNVGAVAASNNSTPATLPSAAIRTKPCRACASPIPMTAKLCKECHSHQGRLRSVLSMSQTTLALLIAFITVATAAIPPVTNLIWGNQSRLTASFWKLQVPSAVITVSNMGDRPGFIDGAILYVPQADAQLGTVFSGVGLRLQGDDKVMSQQVSRHAFELDDGWQRTMATTLYGARSINTCHIEFRLRQFDGSISTMYHDVECRRAFAELAPAVRSEILAMPIEPAGP